jgi:hypothetical protein
MEASRVRTLWPEPLGVLGAQVLYVEQEHWAPRNGMKRNPGGSILLALDAELGR